MRGHGTQIGQVHVWLSVHEVLLNEYRLSQMVEDKSMEDVSTISEELAEHYKHITIQ